MSSWRAAADDHAVRVERQDALVELDRPVGAALELVGEREVGQDELRLRVQLERFQIVVLGLVELAGRGVDTPQVVVAEDRAGVLGDQALERRDRLLGLALLAVEGAQVEVGVLALRIELQHALVRGDGLVVAPEGGEDACLETERLQVGRLGLHHRIHLLEGAVELAAADVERGETQAQERRVGIGRHCRLEGRERRVHVVPRERHLALQEAPHRHGIRRQLDH